MSITLLQLSQRLQGMAGYLEGPEHGNIMVKMASEALALNKQRVQETGKNAKGEMYAPYSTKPMLSGSKNLKSSVANSLLSTKKKRAELDWVKVKGHSLFVIKGGYAEYRKLMGHTKHSFVDFTLSGRMWDNVKLISPRSELESGVAVIRATEPLQQKKLEGNTKKRGEILGLSKSEIEWLNNVYEGWVEGGLRKNKLL